MKRNTTAESVRQGRNSDRITADYAIGKLGFAIAPLPIHIARNPDQHNRRSPEGFGGTSDDRIQGPCSADEYINRRKPRISRAAIRPRNVRSLPAQPEQRNHREGVREDHAVDDIRIELVVTPAECQRGRPDALPNQTKGWCPPLRMNLCHALEEDS